MHCSDDFVQGQAEDDFSTFSPTYCQQLKSILIVGPSGVLSSYYGAFLFLTKGNEVVQKGYDQVARNFYVIRRS
jgi:hypothetical protein